jgi:transcription-repair coupling factor (superfamily II helicase)
MVVSLKRLCREAGVEKPDAGPKDIVLSFRGNKFRNPSGLASWVTSKGDLIRLRPDHKLAIARGMTVADRVRIARDVAANLNRLVQQAKAA